MIFIGILGFGKLGQYLYENIKKSPDYEISFIWNRSQLKVKDSVPKELILTSISDIPARKCHLVIEVCHPDVIVDHAQFILQHCDLMVGSPTAFCEKDILDLIMASATSHALYIAAGAMWGIEDLRKLNDSNTLKSLTITMEKHPYSFKLSGPCQEKNEEAKKSRNEVILYDGPVKELCKWAPNNVNTMACASLAASRLGFDGVRGRLIANRNNLNTHVVTIEVESTSGLKVITQRINPANVGEVTGYATFNSFLSSLKRAKGAKSGLNFC